MNQSQELESHPHLPENLDVVMTKAHSSPLHSDVLLFKIKLGAGERAQQIKVPVTKSDNLSLTPHMEGENSLL